MYRLGAIEKETLRKHVFISSQLIQFTGTQVETRETHWQHAWEIYNLSYIFEH